MITGDASRTAVAIAREIGSLRANRVVEGAEFTRLSDRTCGTYLRNRGALHPHDAQVQAPGVNTLKDRASASP